MPIKCKGCGMEYTHPADIEEIHETGYCITCYKRQQEIFEEDYYNRYVDDELTRKADLEKWGLPDEDIFPLN